MVLERKRIVQYQNPIIKGFYPDPSICRVEDTFYLVNSSFQFLPGVPLFASKDLVNWKQIGHCLTKSSQVDMRGVECSMGIFAPTLRFYEGKFYLVTTNIVKDQGSKYKDDNLPFHMVTKNFILTTDNLEGEWSEPIFIDINGIDPSLFFEDGKAYVQYAIFETGIAQVEIDVNTGKLLTEPIIITKGSGGCRGGTSYVSNR